MDEKPGKPFSLRRFQFSIASLLVLVGLLACILGYAVQRNRSKQRAIARILDLGGTVVFDYQWSDKGAWLSDAQPPGPRWLRSIFGDTCFANPVEVQLFEGDQVGLQTSPEEFTDADLRCLSVLTEVKWLVLMDTSVSDAGLVHLRGLKKLERLDLEGSAVTVGGARELQSALPQLRVYVDGM